MAAKNMILEKFIDILRIIQTRLYKCINLKHAHSGNEESNSLLYLIKPNFNRLRYDFCSKNFQNIAVFIFYLDFTVFFIKTLSTSKMI